MSPTVPPTASILATTTEDVPLLDDDALDALDASALAAPDGFADRVLAAQRRARPTVRRPVRRRAWAIAGAACALLTLGVWRLRASAPARSGELVATARTTEAIGDRAIAVVEPGGALRWTITHNTVRVTQPRGSAFYRVDRGGPFAVETPAGSVTVEGTCFTVEVTQAFEPREPAMLVIVHEGRVAVSGPRGVARLAAGERLFARGSTAPEPSQAIAASAPHASQTSPPDDDLASTSAPIASTIELDHHELAAMAAECRLTWDEPLVGHAGDRITPRQAIVLGLDEPTRVALDSALRALEQRAFDELRAIYTEVTGEPNGALSWDALKSEIADKSPHRDVQEAFRRLSAERAGLAAAPSDLSGTLPVERMYRLLTSIGDRYERELANTLGTVRARALRALDGGWGSRHSTTPGCPR